MSLIYNFLLCYASAFRVFVCVQIDACYNPQHTIWFPVEVDLEFVVAVWGAQESETIYN